MCDKDDLFLSFNAFDRQCAINECIYSDVSSHADITTVVSQTDGRQTGQAVPPTWPLSTPVAVPP